MTDKQLEQSKVIGEFCHPEMLDKEKIEREGLEVTENMLAKMAVYLNRFKITRYFTSYDWIIPVIQKIVREHMYLASDEKDACKMFAKIAAMSLSNPVDVMAEKTAEYIIWFNEFTNKNK
jgi:hypothetical protein